MLTLIAVLLFSTVGKGQFYTGSTQDFGKNRIQHRDFLWRYYKFKQFNTYFYTGGKDLAIYTAKRAAKHIEEVESLFDFSLEEKLQIIIYNKHSHFKQSNIGYSRRKRYNIGGTTPIVGNKLFIYYEGEHRSLDRQIREGIARVMVRQMMYGGDWKEVIKNSTLLTVPEWYLNGVVSYASTPWNETIDSRVRDGILSGRYEKFNRLKGKDAVYAGHAIWKYIADVYGEGVIPNILYMTKMSRNVESGLLFVLGVSLNTLTEDYLEHYRKIYGREKDQRMEPQLDSMPVKSRKRTVYSQFEISPNGRYAAYVSNELGKYKIWLYDLEKEKKTKLFKDGHKLDRIKDESYPVLEWHPGGEALAFVTEQKGEPKFHLYTLEDEELSTKPLFELEKVLDMEYSPNGRKMVFSGVKHGQTDLYLYQPTGNTSEKLTNDVQDDLSPAFLDGGSRLIFSSNRVDDTLRPEVSDKKYIADDLDLFIYDLEDRGRVLERVTETKHSDEIDPSSYDSTKFTFLSDKNGIRNRYLGKFDSTISHVDTSIHYRYYTVQEPLTNYPRSILHYEFQPSSGNYSLLYFVNGNYRFYYGNRSGDRVLPSSSLTMTAFKHSEVGESNVGDGDLDRNRIQQFQKEEGSDSSEVNINDYVFEDEKRDSSKGEGKKPSFPSVKEVEEGLDTNITMEPDSSSKDSFELPTQRNYKTNFSTQQVTTQLDNGYMNESYQKFNPGNPVFNNPGINGLITMAINDLFEDHHLYGGIRLSGNLNNNEYFITYEDLSKRMDKRYTFHRQSFLNIGNNVARKNRILEGKYELIWPFSEVSSVRGTFSLRNDRKTTLATEQQTLQEPSESTDRGGLKLEYVFDNTLPLGINLRRGVRLKFWGEYFQVLENFDNGDMFVVGGDVRHYLRIHRNLIWANRIAGSTSFGSQKLVYYMGGVDKWFLPQFNNNVPIANDQNYMFQALATPMRGFSQNARNGNSFAVINSELRFPIFDYLTYKPIKSDFLKNFQVIGFGDVGTAWTGEDPYSEDNSFNERTEKRGPITVTVRTQKEPIIGGFGFGLRSRIWGYFVRASWAWGVEDRQVQEPQFYLSLSKDF